MSTPPPFFHDLSQEVNSVFVTQPLSKKWVAVGRSLTRLVKILELEYLHIKDTSRESEVLSESMNPTQSLNIWDSNCWAARLILQKSKINLILRISLDFMHFRLGLVSGGLHSHDSLMSTAFFYQNTESPDSISSKEKDWTLSSYLDVLHYNAVSLQDSRNKSASDELHPFLEKADYLLSRAVGLSWIHREVIDSTDRLLLVNVTEKALLVSLNPQLSNMYSYSGTLGYLSNLGQLLTVHPSENVMKDILRSNIVYLAPLFFLSVLYELDRMNEGLSYRALDPFSALVHKDRSRRESKDIITMSLKRFTAILNNNVDDYGTVLGINGGANSVPRPPSPSPSVTLRDLTDVGFIAKRESSIATPLKVIHPSNHLSTESTSPQPSPALGPLGTFDRLSLEPEELKRALWEGLIGFALVCNTDEFNIVGTRVTASIASQEISPLQPSILCLDWLRAQRSHRRLGSTVPERSSFESPRDSTVPKISAAEYLDICLELRDCLLADVFEHDILCPDSEDILIEGTVVRRKIKPLLDWLRFVVRSLSNSPSVGSSGS